MTDRIDVQTANALLDFTGGGAGAIGADAARDQLEGALALHNMLATQKVAYIADEVGMGKTYVALGAIALLRHFQPSLRVLVVAPRKNIQDKWVREWENFVRTIVRVEDMRVKAIGGRPARALIRADSLVDLATKVSLDPDRDFFARLTSFSVSFDGDTDGARKRRKALLDVVPSVDPNLLNLQSKDRFKLNFGRALNSALPEFDLVVVDEGHNLKAGWSGGRGSTRNMVLGCAIGGYDREAALAEGFRTYGGRAKRLLILSATPIEHDFRQLWAQLDLLGFGKDWEALKDPEVSNDEKRELVRGFLIRRTGSVTVGGQKLTKNQYRREWRHGGVVEHDQPLSIPDDSHRLAVALVQKKVSEIIGDPAFNHSFQVGLLASFESFVETAIGRDAAADSKNAAQAASSDDAVFHVPRELELRESEAEGLDSNSINRIAKSHFRTFNRPMPHPKMDAITTALARALDTGQKALVFVRRVASVDELQQRLEQLYDDRLFQRLRSELNGKPREEIEVAISAYTEERAELRAKVKAWTPGGPPKADGAPHIVEKREVDSFFAWFFRGEGPDLNLLTGARIAERLDQASGVDATMLLDNYVAAILKARPGEVTTALAEAVGMSLQDIVAAVQAEADPYLSGAKRILRRDVYEAFQRAALAVLVNSRSALQAEAAEVLHLFFPPEATRKGSAGKKPALGEWLEVDTFFSALRRRTKLREALWPEPTRGTVVERWREQDLRRELFATMVRRGHPIIDLFVLIANRTGTLGATRRSADAAGTSGLEADFLDCLERQQPSYPTQFSSYYELAEAASNFELIVTQNAQRLRESTPREWPTLLGRLLRAQRPIGGMAGTVNSELVRQFRMPGYPLVLVTTDLLQEGEDLHTFCSSVVHYGIAWMPSALEQRVGRIDRVSSQTERRLSDGRDAVSPHDRLQVYYPHLRETVEVLQVNRVLERLNRFMRLMHEHLGTPDDESAKVDVADEMLRVVRDIAPIDRPLESAFRVTPAMLVGKRKPLAVTTERSVELHARFKAISSALERLDTRWYRTAAPGQLKGVRTIGVRVQPFVVLLRGIHGRPLLRCISPVGIIPWEYWDRRHVASFACEPFTRVSLFEDERLKSYHLAVEGDVMLGASSADAARARLLVQAVTAAADRVEAEIFGSDRGIAEFDEDLDQETYVAR
jgi:hypothetical protein